MIDPDAERDFAIECEVDDLEIDLKAIAVKFTENGSYYKGHSERFFHHTVKSLARILQVECNTNKVAKEYERVEISSHWISNKDDIQNSKVLQRLR